MSSSSFLKSVRPIEGLEPRLLLSAYLTPKGTLVAEGTSGADTIVVKRDPQRPSKILATINGAGAKFAAISVKRIEIYGAASADDLTLDDSLGIISARGATIFGGTGDDTCRGGLASMAFDGGDGDDEIRGSSKNDTIWAGDGDDLVFGGRGNDVIVGSTGDDSLYGAQGDDLLYGDAGNDSIFGEAGNDTLGGDGEDRVWFKGFSAPAPVTGNDSLDGGDGDDWITGGDESATLHDQNNGLDTITGGAGNDVLDARSWDTDSSNPDDVITDRAAGDVVPMEDHTRQATAGEIAQGEDAYAVHVHAELIVKVWYNGSLRQITIPSGVGDFVSPTIDDTSPRMHVHDDEEGILHMHDLDPGTFTLGEFFRNWGLTISADHLGRYVAGNGHTLSFIVRHGNGQVANITDPYNYVIQGAPDYTQGDRITVTYV
jgi:hypothetical protein